MAFPEWVKTIVRPEDIVMGFAPPEGDPVVEKALAFSRSRGAQTFGLPGKEGDYAVDPPDEDPLIHQE